MEAEGTKKLTELITTSFPVSTSAIVELPA